MPDANTRTTSEAMRSIERTQRIAALLPKTRLTAPESSELLSMLAEERAAAHSQLDMANVSREIAGDGVDFEASIATRIACLRMRCDTLIADVNRLYEENRRLAASEHALAGMRERAEKLERWAVLSIGGERVIKRTMFGQYLKRLDVLSLFPPAPAEQPTSTGDAEWIHWAPIDGSKSACGDEWPRNFVSNDAMRGVTCVLCLARLREDVQTGTSIAPAPAPEGSGEGQPAEGA